MTRAQYGWVATITGAALAAGWWWRQRGSVARRLSEVRSSRGDVIFSNSPVI